MQKENPFEELYDRVHKTAASRFFAHDRLKAHQNASIWTITASSLILIIIPLAQTFEIQYGFTNNQLNFIQVSLAITILVLSAILSMANFSVRAEKIHQCGMILNALARKIHRHISDKSGSDVYDQLAKEYDDTLQKYENHTPVDYLYTKNHLTASYRNPWYFPIYIRIRYAFEFFWYFVLLGVELFVLFDMLMPSA